MHKYLELEFGDSIAVTGNGFSNTQGIFVAFQENLLVWIAVVSGVVRLLSTDITNLSIAKL
ncbi:hypothetical protein ACFPN4_14570 [Ureibacillus thermophilus]|uniref:Uncharacterized protein n=1 Tax=Ureibacillus thermophilus TaxID=367743 RepID=A0A4P6USE1_9BACL|nr:hypothetical protein [Ureibacillus thermophilus]QBK26229.1 hypothetical protein DKZ56_10360 [Ureibacillus thermophilus]